MWLFPSGDSALASESASRKGERSVRPERVEGLPFLDRKAGQGFDKLSLNGIGTAWLTS
jgi:hypothetical protein